MFCFRLFVVDSNDENRREVRIAFAALLVLAVPSLYQRLAGDLVRRVAAASLRSPAVATPVDARRRSHCARRGAGCAAARCLQQPAGGRRTGAAQRQQALAARRPLDNALWLQRLRHGRQRAFISSNLNIFSNVQQSNFEALRDELQRERVELLGLLETDLSRLFFGNLDLVEFLAVSLGMHSDAGSPPGENTWGCAVLSRYPIVCVVLLCRREKV